MYFVTSMFVFVSFIAVFVGFNVCTSWPYVIFASTFVSFIVVFDGFNVCRSN